MKINITAKSMSATLIQIPRNANEGKLNNVYIISTRVECVATGQLAF